MTQILKFTNWLSENEQRPRSLKHISDLGINRKFSRDPFTGDKYETELFPMFRRLKPRIDALPKKPTLEEFFILMQNSDDQFYSMVQADTLAQPDVRELWRDLTGRRASRMKKYNLSENSDPTAWMSQIDPEWTVLAIWPTDEGYEKFKPIFSSLGIAFSDVNSKTIFVDGAAIEDQNLTTDHLLAIEAHEIAHGILSHKASDREASYDERQEREADWFAIRLLDMEGHTVASNILETRYSNEYSERSEDLDGTDRLQQMLISYLK